MSRSPRRGPPARASAGPALREVFAEPALSQLERWREEERASLAALLRGLPGPVHRELVQRAVAAGHRLEDVSSFAETLSGLSASAAAAACCPSDRIDLACDPLAALRASQAGRERAKDARKRSARVGDVPTVPAQPSREFESESAPPDPRAPSRSAEARDHRASTRSTEALSPGPTKRAPSAETPSRDPLLSRRSSVPAPRDALADQLSGKRLRSELGASEEPSRSQTRPGNPEQTEAKLNEALAPLGLSVEERLVDGPGYSLEQALDAAAAALEEGLPVPVSLGREVGARSRYALLLQVQLSGKRRAFQLYDPIDEELVWVHEADLLRRAELPLSSKRFRRVTAVALPKTSRRTR